MTLVFGCLSFRQSEVGGSGYHYSPSAALFEQIHACKPIKTAKYIHGHWSHFRIRLFQNFVLSIIWQQNKLF